MIISFKMTGITPEDKFNISVASQSKLHPNDVVNIIISAADKWFESTEVGKKAWDYMDKEFDLKHFSLYLRDPELVEIFKSRRIDYIEIELVDNSSAPDSCGVDLYLDTVPFA